MAEDKNKPNPQERDSIEFGAPPKASSDKKDAPKPKDKSG